MIKVDSIFKSYGNHLVLEDISFSVGKGETVGLLGPNGAGKTTLLKILSAFHMADSGTVEIDTISINEDSLKAKSKIGYLSEMAPLYEYMTVAEYLKFMISAMEGNRSESEEEMNHLLDLFSLQKLRNKLISKLSSGYKQRCAIAGALTGNISLLILDEPAKGLDPLQIVELRDIIRSYSKDMTVLISSHILSEIELLCPRVIILDQGKLKYDTLDDRQINNGIITFSVEVSGKKENLDAISKNKSIHLKSIKNIGDSYFELLIEISKEEYLENKGLVISEIVFSNSLNLHKLEMVKNSLENIYMKIMGSSYE